MDELPPELIDVCFKYVSNANLYKLYLTSLDCHVLSSRHLKHCKYAMAASKEKVNIIEWISGSPMAYLAYKGNLEGVKYLHSIGKDCTELAMECAAREGHLEVVKYLHSIGKDCRTSTMTMAAHYGHLEIVKYLHSIGKDCTTNAMDWAAKKGHLEVVKYLHSIGKECTDSGIDLATKKGHLEVVKYLHSIKYKQWIRQNRSSMWRVLPFKRFFYALKIGTEELLQFIKK